MPLKSTLTGETNLVLTMSPLLRIKDNVAHAGLSRLPLLLKLHGKDKIPAELFRFSLSNSLLIVQLQHGVMQDVMVVGWTMRSVMLKLMQWNQVQPIHIQQSKEPANILPLKESSK
jgi:hypothetical protein